MGRLGNVFRRLSDKAGQAGNVAGRLSDNVRQSGNIVRRLGNVVRQLGNDVCKSSDVAEQAENKPIRLKTGSYRPKSPKTGAGGRLQRPAATAGHPARDGDGEKIRAGIPAATRRVSGTLTC